MKIKITVLLSAMVLCGTLFTGPAIGDTYREALETIVDEYIASCEAKSVMLESGSENIRKAAMLSCLKATFCRNCKARLIDALVANRVAPKPHAVQAFLNDQFNDLIKSQEVASTTAYPPL